MFRRVGEGGYISRVWLVSEFWKVIILQKEEQEKGILTVPIAAISRTEMKLADQPNQEHLFCIFD